MNHLSKYFLLTASMISHQKSCKMLFISSQKLFSFQRYLKFCLVFLVMQKKLLDQKDKIKFQIYDVTSWLKDNNNTHVLNISPIKGNQTVKYSQLIKFSNRNIFSQNHAENEPGRIVPELFLFYKKALHKVKASCLQLSFTIFRQPSNKHTIEQ